jgi:flagellar capping protein FliD
LVENLAQTRKKLAELAPKKGKKKVGSTAEETGETNEVEEDDVEIDPVGTRVGGVLTKQGKNISYTTAAKTLKKVADNITNTTLKRQIAQESIFKSCSSMGMVKIPVGYCVTGPLKVNGKVWNVNLRTINEEAMRA